MFFQSSLLNVASAMEGEQARLVKKVKGLNPGRAQIFSSSSETLVVSWWLLQPMDGIRVWHTDVLEHYPLVSGQSPFAFDDAFTAPVRKCPNVVWPMLATVEAIDVFGSSMA